MTDRDLVDDIVDAWRTELPEAAGLPLEVSKRVTKLAELFTVAIEPVLDEHGVTKVEYGVLATLRSAGDPYRLKPGELSDSLVITTGGLSNVLVRLTDEGLVARDPDPADRRSSWVRLTTDGVTVAESLVRGVTTAQTRLLAPLDDQTGRRLADLLREAIVAVHGPQRPPRARRRG